MKLSNDIKDKVRNLVSRNELESAINLLENSIDNENQKNELINIKRRLNNLTRQSRVGIIRKDDEIIEQNIISNAILELTNSNFDILKPKENKEEKRPKSNLSQIVLAVCGVLTILFGFYKFNQSSNEENKEHSTPTRDTLIINHRIPTEINPTFNQNPPITKLYTDFLDDFDTGTTMQLVRDKLGSPNYIETDYVNIFEDKIGLELERYSYHFDNGSVDIWSDSTKQKIEIIELHSGTDEIKFEIPTLSYRLEMNGEKRKMLGDIKFKDIEGTYRATYIIEGIINDFPRFDFYMGRYGGYRNYVFSNSSVYRYLNEKGIDSEEISNDSILNLIQELKPNSIALY